MNNLTDIKLDFTDKNTRYSILSEILDSMTEDGFISGVEYFLEECSAVLNERDAMSNYDLCNRNDIIRAIEEL